MSYIGDKLFKSHDFSRFASSWEANLEKKIKLIPNDDIEQILDEDAFASDFLKLNPFPRLNVDWAGAEVFSNPEGSSVKVGKKAKFTGDVNLFHCITSSKNVTGGWPTGAISADKITYGITLSATNTQHSKSYVTDMENDIKSYVNYINGDISRAELLCARSLAMQIRDRKNGISAAKAALKNLTD